MRIVDRTQALVIRDGYNVYPREVEETVMRHPGGAQVTVTGVPDEQYGEEIMAGMVPDEGTRLDAWRIVALSREQLRSHKYPRRIDIVEELQLGPSMKVLKRELRTRYSDTTPSC